MPGLTSDGLASDGTFVATCAAMSANFGAVVVVIISTLVFKKWKEGPRRPWLEFILDSSKQLAGVQWAHELNGLLLQAQNSNPAVGGCPQYLVGTMVDATFGVLVEYALLNTISFMLERADGDTRDFLTGDYRDEMNRPIPRAYIKQMAVWLGCVTGAKLVIALCVYRLFFCLNSFAQLLLALVAWNRDLEVAFVMVVTPCSMGAVQVWLTDGFIQKGGLPFAECWQGAMYTATAVVADLRAKITGAPGCASPQRRGGLRTHLLGAAWPKVDGGHQERDLFFESRERRDRAMADDSYHLTAQQLAEERQAVEEARDAVKREITELQDALRRQIEFASEDAVERQGLRTQVLDLEEQLARCQEEQDARANDTMEKETRLQAHLQHLAAATAATARAAPDNDNAMAAAAAAAAVATAVVPTTRGVVGASVAQEGRRPHAALPVRGDEEIVALSRHELARLTPDQVQLAAAQRGAVLDRKLGVLEAKLRELAWRSASGGLAALPPGARFVDQGSAGTAHSMQCSHVAEEQAIWQTFERALR